MAIYQCAQLFNNPHLWRERAIRQITKYLTSTYTYKDLPYVNRHLSTRGLVYRINKEKVIEYYLYADFASGWVGVDAENAENVMLRAVYVITYVVCTLLW